LNIITKYIIREFLKIFFLCLATCMGLFFVIDLSVHYLDNFSEYNPPVLLTVLFCSYKIPQIFYWMCPMAILLAIFLSLALFSRNNEIIAMKAGGISVYKIITPLVVMSGCLVLISFVNQELIMPYTSQRAEYTENIRIKQKKGKRLLKQDRFWYRSDDTICSIDLFEYNSNTLKGITLYFFDKQFNLVKRIDAGLGKWVENRWKFYNLVIRSFNPGGSMDIEISDEKIIPLRETPDDFKTARREPEEMSYAELRDYIAKIERAGYKIPEYAPYLYAKISFPFICLIMPFLAIPLALRVGRGGGIAWGVGLSVIIGFTHFVFFNFSLSLGRAELLPPLLSAWAANIIFGAIGIFLLLQVRQ
jgi:lipopolysaccharide export system permease protein